MDLDRIEHCREIIRCAGDVKRYKALPLLERMKDRGQLMKHVPLGVVATLDEAAYVSLGWQETG